MQNAILLHNQHWNDVPFEISIKRRLLEKLLKFHESKEIQIITGLRRSGKSSLLKLYINELIKTEDPRSILFINFDDPNFFEVYKKPEKIYDVVEAAESLTQTKVRFLFLDEIQSVHGWEKFIKSVYDAGRFEKICITGSNSRLLMGDYSHLLSGRYIANRLYPLSLWEVLQYHGYPGYLSVVQSKTGATGILLEILKFGSFPEVILQKDEELMHELLINYYDSILIRDCIIHKRIRDVFSFKELAFYLFNNISSLYTYNSLSRATGINDISIKEYIGAMKDAFMIYEVPNFSFKIKKQIKSKRKIYTIDNGLITAISLDFSANRGRLFENLVFAELKKAGFEDIFMYNDSRECDFIIKAKDGLVAIQAAYEINTGNREREIAGLHHAAGKTGAMKLFVVTMAQAETIGDISIIPVYELNKIGEPAK